MQIISYCRVSTLVQAADGESLATQKATIERWAAQQGHVVIASFEDAGKSGGNITGRPAILEAVALACRRRATLVVSSLSRLSRCTRDALGVVDQLNKAGAALISIGDGIDSSNVTGRLLWTIMSAVSEWERSVNNERTAQVLDHMRRRRMRISGALPFGWSLADDGVNLVPVEHEQQTLAHMQAMRAAGASYPKIAADLEQRGILSKQGRARWMAKSIRAILVREASIAAGAA